MARSNTGLFISILLLVFGPKICGIVDLSVLVSLFIICFYLVINGLSFSLPTDIFKYILFMGFIFVYSIGAEIWGNTLDFVFLGRMLRAVLCYYAVFLLINNYRSKDESDIQTAILNVLMIHSIIVILGAFCLSVQVALDVITGIGDKVRLYRSTGLTSGYDMAGVMCNLGVVLSLSAKQFSVLSFLIFAFAVLFTSRLSIIMTAMILTLFLFKYSKKEGLKKRAICCISFVLCVLFASLIILARTTNTFSRFYQFFIGISPTVANMGRKISSAYHIADLKEAFLVHYNLNNTAIEIILGTGKYGGVDPGYLRIINCIGIVGLCLVIIWHILYFLPFYKRTAKDQIAKPSHFIMDVLVLIIVVLDFKNSYFFTRNFFPIMVLEMELTRRQLVNSK